MEPMQADENSTLIGNRVQIIDKKLLFVEYLFSIEENENIDGQVTNHIITLPKETNETFSLFFFSKASKSTALLETSRGHSKQSKNKLKF